VREVKPGPELGQLTAEVRVEWVVDGWVQGFRVEMHLEMKSRVAPSRWEVIGYGLAIVR